MDNKVEDNKNLIQESEWKAIIYQKSKNPKKEFSMDRIISLDENHFAWKINTEQGEEYIDITNWLFPYDDKGEIKQLTFPQLLVYLKFGMTVGAPDENKIEENKN
jgi:hypothetical protein